MSDRVKWIDSDGKKILYVDASGLSKEDYLNVVLEYEKEILPYKNKKSILLLLDVTNSFSNQEINNKQKELASYNVSRATAVVGVTGIKKVLAKAIKKAFHFEDSVDKAINWLVNQ